MNSWKIILAAVVIFGAGVVTGGLLVKCVDRTHQAHRPPLEVTAPPQTGGHDQPPRPGDLPKLRPPEMWGKEGKDFVRKLDHALQLTPDQREVIHKIIADGQKRNGEIWSNAVPQMRHVMQEVTQHIREQLTPEQQKQFEELLKQLHPAGHRPQPPPPTNGPPMIAPTNPPPGV